MSAKVIFKHLLLLLSGVPLTLEIVAAGLLLGLALGCLTALVTLRKTPVLSQLAAVYVYVVRGTPLLVQIFLIYFGFGQLDFIRERPDGPSCGKISGARSSPSP